MNYSDDPMVLTVREREEATLGPLAAATWIDDPRRLLFVLSRYKFVAKMLAGKHLLEEGVPTVGHQGSLGRRPKVSVAWILT